jgi:hypothetical protein
MDDVRVELLDPLHEPATCAAVPHCCHPHGDRTESRLLSRGFEELVHYMPGGRQ